MPSIVTVALLFFWQEFKETVHPKTLDIEMLNQTAQDLTKDSPTETAAYIKSPMSDVNRKWEELLDGISDRKVRVDNVSIDCLCISSAVLLLISVVIILCMLYSVYGLHCIYFGI